MRDSYPVTFIGGPWDMTRRVFSVEDLRRGSWCVDSPPQQTQEQLSRRKGLEAEYKQPTTLACRVVRYNFIPIGYGPTEIWIGVLCP